MRGWTRWGAGPGSRSYSYKWLSRDLIPGLCGTVLLSRHQATICGSRKSRSLHRSFPAQLRREAIRWALWGLGEPGPRHQHVSAPLCGSQSASLSSRLVSGGSWEAWKGFGVSRVWPHELARQAILGPAHQEKQNCSSLGGACTLWWRQSIQCSLRKAPGPELATHGFDCLGNLLGGPRVGEQGWNS